MDVFKEQIVKRQVTFKDTAIKVCLIILVILIGFLILMSIGPQFGVIIILALIFGARFLISYLNVEYEYAFTSGELDIDIIYDRTRRKRVFSANVKQIEIMAHIEDRNHKAAFDGAQETRDYSSGVIGLDTYVFLTVKDGKKIKVIIDPNEKMLKAFSSVLTRRNLHLRPGVVLLP